MKRARLSMLARAALAAVACALAPARARAADDDAKEPYFYKGYEYGSQSLYNPIYVFVNRGFDMLQLRPENRVLWHQTFAIDGRNVADNLADPFNAVDRGPGWGRFARQEILPLSWDADTGRWIPNYALHLLGGGQTYRQLREWYTAHDAPLPALWSIGTLFSAAFVNEMIENRGVQGVNTDALADLYIFDTAGVLLFSMNDVAEFFSKTVISSDWSLQPAITYPNGALHNVGNYYAAKAPVPFVDRLRLFAYGGASTLFGLSYKIDSEYSISAAGGGRLDNFRNSSLKQVLNVVTVQPAGAIFIDRNESLLASIEVANIKDYFIHVNVYPNAFKITDPGVGFWTVLGQDGRWLLGLSMTRSFGLGLGGGTL